MENYDKYATLIQRLADEMLEDEDYFPYIDEDDVVALVKRRWRALMPRIDFEDDDARWQFINLAESILEQVACGYVESMRESTMCAIETALDEITSRTDYDYELAVARDRFEAEAREQFERQLPDIVYGRVEKMADEEEVSGADFDAYYRANAVAVTAEVMREFDSEILPAELKEFEHDFAEHFDFES